MADRLAWFAVGVAIGVGLGIGIAGFITASLAVRPQAERQVTLEEIERARV